MLDALQITHKAITAEQFYLAKINPGQTVIMNALDDAFVEQLDQEFISILFYYVSICAEL